MQITSILRSLGFVSVSASLAACGGSEGDTKSDLAGVAGGSPGGTGSVSNPGSTGGEGSVLTLGTGSVSIDNLAHEMAIITCDLVSRCDAGSGVLGTGFPQQCVSNLEKVFADQSIASLKQAIASGKSIYDGSKVRACFDLYPELACDYSNEKVLYSACANIWGGSVAPGGACNSSFECASGNGDNVCRSSTGTCPGVCTARTGLGSPCPRDNDCAQGFACDSTDMTCKASLKLGEPCGASNPNGGTCGGLANCAEASPGQYQCTSQASVTSGQEGDTCERAGCATGLLCTAERTDDGLTLTFRCRKPSSACPYAITNPCPDGQYCPMTLSDVGSKTAQCAAQLDPNQVCTGNYRYECKGDARCYNGKCLARQRIGGPCVSDGDCYSSNCVNALCTAAVMCQP